LRQRTADAVLRLLGAREVEPASPEDVAAIAAGTAEKVFAPEEREMIAGVLDLATRQVRSVMTPSERIVWLDRDAPEAELRRRILEATHTRYPVAQGGLDRLTGVALTQELLCGLLNDGRLSLSGREREPLVVPRDMSVLDLVERLRASPVQMALVRGDSGNVEGIVTPMDVLEAIVGDLPEEGQERRPEEQPA
jgi:CBS domain containing-hemolysin-like protein